MKQGAAARAGALLAPLLALCEPAIAFDAKTLPYHAKVLNFNDISDWAGDDHAAALQTFLNTCTQMAGMEWDKLCHLAQSLDPVAAKSYFEMFFRPVLIEDGQTPLFTGYYEPILNGATARHGPYQFPVYRRPPEMTEGSAFASRGEIETTGMLSGRGLEIAWVDDPVALHFMQVQGSGRISLTNGREIRLGYAGANGQPYVSIGQTMVSMGLMSPHEASAANIGAWGRRNTARINEILRYNPSYVFFREIKGLGDNGPIGAMARPITAMRSIAVDPNVVPLGAPVWIERDTGGIKRLMVAQDTGGAIKGAQRADIFFGTGAGAGDAAATVRDGGRMLVLMPIQVAYALEQGEKF